MKRGEVLRNPVTVDIADSRRATAAHVAIAWVMAHRSFPIPRATTKSHIDKNRGALTLELTDNAMQLLDTLYATSAGYSERPVRKVRRPRYQGGSRRPQEAGRTQL